MTLRQLKRKYLAEGVRLGYKKVLNEKVAFAYNGKENRPPSAPGHAYNYILHAMANINDVTGSKFTSLSRKCLTLLDKAWKIKHGYKKGTEDEIKKCANEALKLMKNAWPEIVKEVEQTIPKILSYYNDAISAVEEVVTDEDKITISSNKN